MPSKKQKNKRAFLIVLGLIILVAIFYFTVLQTAYQPAEITGYKVRSSDASSITYSTVSYASTNGFTSQHALVNSAGQYFYSSGQGSSDATNQAMWRFYLNVNGIDVSKFKDPIQGDIIPCVFSPVSNSYIPDLSSLGLSYSSSFQCYTGNYVDSVLTTMATKLTCSVQGSTYDICYNYPVDATTSSGGIKGDRCVGDSTSYNIQGTVSYYSGNGFVCNVDTSKLISILPSTVKGSPTRAAGVQGIVLFTVKPAATPIPSPTPTRNQFSIQPAIPVTSTPTPTPVPTSNPVNTPTPTPTPVPTSNPVNTPTPTPIPVVTETPVVGNITYNNPVVTPTPTETSSVINPITVNQVQENFITQFWQNYKAVIVIVIVLLILIIIYFVQRKKK